MKGAETRTSFTLAGNVSHTKCTFFTTHLNACDVFSIAHSCGLSLVSPFLSLHVTSISSKPCTCSSKPCTCSSKPCTCSSKPCTCSSKPCTCSSKPCTCSSKPCRCCIKQVARYFLFLHLPWPRLEYSDEMLARNKKVILRYIFSTTTPCVCSPNHQDHV